MFTSIRRALSMENVVIIFKEISDIHFMKGLSGDQERTYNIHSVGFVSFWKFMRNPSYFYLNLPHDFQISQNGEMVTLIYQVLSSIHSYLHQRELENYQPLFLSADWLVFLFKFTFLEY